MFNLTRFTKMDVFDYKTLRKISQMDSVGTRIIHFSILLNEWP